MPRLTVDGYDAPEASPGPFGLDSPMTTTPEEEAASASTDDGAAQSAKRTSELDLTKAGSVGLAGLLGKKWGFSRSVRKAPVFYGLVALGTVGGTALSLLDVNPIKLLVFVAVINGVAAAPFLFVVMRVSSNEQIMGEYVNGKAAKILGWITALIMAVAAIALFATGGVSL
jgi:Mn2+/Fe2+ NRAMP family transporter